LVAYPDGKKGFRPSTDLTGKAGIYFSKNYATMFAAGADKAASWGIDFTLPNLTFEGFKINKVPEGGEDIVTVGNLAGGINTLGLGAWGTSPGLTSPAESYAEAQSAAEKLNKIKELNGEEPGEELNDFPFSLDTPEFTYLSEKKEWKLTLGLSINLMKDKEGEVPEGEPEASGICAETSLGFYFKPHPDKGLEYSGAGLDKIKVEGALGPVEMTAALNFLKAETEEEKKWGKGFKAYADLKVGKGDRSLFSAKAMCQFGAVNAPSGGSGGDFRYFFADLEGIMYTQTPPHFGVMLVNILGVDVLNIHGIGGGIYINMEKKSPLDYNAPEKESEVADRSGLEASEEEEEYEEEDDPLMEPGVSLSGFEYTPRRGSHGGYLKGIFSIVQPKLMAMDLAVGMEIGVNDAEGLTFKKIFGRGDAYLLNSEDIADRREAPITGFAEVEFDIANRKISGAMQVKADANYRPLFYMEADPAVCRGSLLFDFINNDYYFKIGTPQKPFQIKSGFMGRDMSSLFYVQMGKGIDPAPNIAEVAPGWPGGGAVKARNFSPTKGVVLGYRYQMRNQMDIKIFQVGLEFGLGFDVGMGRIEAKCNDRVVGLNGWRMKGQVYAYGKVNVGMAFKLGLIKGNVNIFNAFLGAELNGEFPNPSKFGGSLAGSYSVMGGLVSGKFNLRFDIASAEDLACLNAMVVEQKNPIAEIKIVNETYPKKDEKEVAIFAEPNLAFNYPPNNVFQFDDTDAEGNTTSREFRIQIDPSEGFLLKTSAGATVPAELLLEGQTATLKPKKMLSPNTGYKLFYKLKWQEKKSGAWADMTGEGSVETAEVAFTTGAVPAALENGMLGYQAPGFQQRYWHQGYADARLSFKTQAPNGQSWQTYYFPQKKDVPGVGTVAYDYIARVTRFANGAEEGVYDLPISEYPGLKNFQAPVTTYQQIGSIFVIPKVEIQNAQGLNVAYSGLNDLITTADEWKGKLYKLEIIRLPLLPKVQASTSTQQVTDEDGNQVNLPTSSLPARSNLGEDGLKVLYTYWFATSKYNSLHEKLANVASTQKNATARSDMGHPKDADFTQFKLVNSVSVKDPWYLFRANEGFDEFDLTRIRLNNKVEYKDAYNLRNSLVNFNQQYIDFASKGWVTSKYYPFTLTTLAHVTSAVAFEGGTGNVDNVKSYVTEVMKDVETVSGWKYNFYLPDSDKRKLTDSEISAKKIDNTANLSANSVYKGPSANPFSDKPTFGLGFQDQFSRVTMLQTAYLREAGKFLIRLMGSNPSMHASMDSYYNCGQAVRQYPYDQPAHDKSVCYGYHWSLQKFKTTVAENADFKVYDGALEIQFPQLARWTDMGQTVIIANYPSTKIRVHGNGIATSTNTVAQNGGNRQWEVAFNTSQQLNLLRCPEDADVRNIEITVNGVRRGFWEAATRQVDLYDGAGKRSILFDKAMPRPGDNFGETWKLPSNWTDPFKSPASIQFIITYNNGTAETAKLPATASATATARKRDKALRFYRGAGSNANMLQKQMLGEQGDWSFGKMLLVEKSTKIPVAFLDGTSLTRYDYTATGCILETSTYADNAPLCLLDPTKTYLLYCSRSGDANFTAALELGANFWDDKVGQIFEKATFKDNLGAAVRPELKPFNSTASISIPGKIESEHYATLTTTLASGQGFAYKDTEQTNYGPQRKDEWMDTYDQGIGWFFKNEWVNYKINVTTAGQYVMVISYSAFHQDDHQLVFEIDGAPLFDTTVVLKRNGNQGGLQSRRLEWFSLPAGEHVIRVFNKDAILNLEFFDLQLAKPDIKVKTAGSLLPDGSTSAGGGDFGSIACAGSNDEKTFTLENGGNAGLTLSGNPLVAISGANAADFEVTQMPPKYVPAGGSATFKIRFKPNATNLGVRNATVTVLSNSAISDETTYTFAIKAAHSRVEIDLKSGTESFPSQQISVLEGDKRHFGSTAGTVREFALYNYGNTTMLPAYVLEGEAKAEFSVTGFPASIAPGEGKTFSVKFNPAANGGGERLAYVKITSADCDENPYWLSVAGALPGQEIELSGSGILIPNGATAPNTATAANGRYFGEVALANSVMKTYTIRNTGEKPLTLSGYSTTNMVEFQLSGISFPRSVAPGERVDFTVRHNNPQSACNRCWATITVNSNDADESVYTFRVEATGTTAAPGQCLDFDGTDDKIEVSGINLANQSFSVEFYARRMQSNRNDFAIGQGVNEPNTALHIGYRSSNEMTFAFFANDLNAPTSSSDLNWHHWAFVYNKNIASGNNRFIYRDGVQVAADRAAADYAGSGVLNIGWAGAGDYFKGNLDEVRIWNRPLHPDEINARKGCELRGDEDGLLAYYKFNQGISSKNNANETNLAPTRGPAGELKNFALDGTASNFFGFSILPVGVSCPPFTPTSILSLEGGPVSASGAGSAVAKGSTTPAGSNGTDLGTRGIGATSSQPFILRNSGTGPLTISSITVSGANAADFTGVVPAAIAPGQRGTFELLFKPGAAGVRTATVTVNSNDPVNPAWSFAVKGTGAEAATALDFDGVDDRVTCGNTAPVRITGNAISLEAWINPRSWQTGWRGYIINKEDEFGRGYMLACGDGGKAYFSVGYDYGGTMIETAATLRLNEWAHLAAVYDGVSLTIYINGLVRKSQKLESWMGSPTIGDVDYPLAIGSADVWGPYLFDGKIDEVRVWNVALSASQISGRMNCELKGDELGLVAYYDFNNGIANASNAGLTTLKNKATAGGSGNDGALEEFALNASASNWVPASGSRKPPFGRTCVPNAIKSQMAVKRGDPAQIVTPNATVDLGLCGVNTPLDAPFTIANGGGGALKLAASADSRVIVSGDAGFTVSQQPGVQTVAALTGTTTFTLRFKPTSAGIKEATVTVSGTNDPTYPNYAFKVRGEGIAPEIAVLNGSVEIPNGSTSADNATAANGRFFGEVGLNESVPKVFTLSNTGRFALDVSGITSGNTNEFVISGISFPASIAPGEQRNFTITHKNPGTLCNRCWTNITVNNTDADESAYTFRVEAIGKQIPGGAAASLDFDGMNDYLSLPKLPLSPNGGTVEFWFKPETAGNRTLMQLSDNTSFQIMQWSDGNFYIWAGGNRMSAPFAPMNAWSHVALVWSGAGNTARAYLNGNQIAAITQGAATFTGGMFFGGSPVSPANETLKGKMDELRLWNRPLSADEIAARRNCELQGSEPGLVAYYKFNQGTDNANNSTVKTLRDYLAVANGTLVNFTLNGASSNWVKTGSIPVGTRCAEGVGMPSMTVKSAGGSSIFAGSTAPSESDGAALGNVPQGTSKDATFTIANSGAGGLTLPANVVKISGENANEFSVVQQPATSVSANSSTTFKLRFSPAATAAGARSAVVTVTSSDPLNSQYTFAVQGVAVSAGTGVSVLLDNVLVSGAKHIGSVGKGSEREFVFTLKNNSPTALLNLTGSPKITVEGANAAQFSVSEQPPAGVNPGSSVTFKVKYAPLAYTASGAKHSAVFKIKHNGPTTEVAFTLEGDSPMPAALVTLDGKTMSDQNLTTAQAATAAVQFDFGSQSANTTKVLRLKNHVTVPFSVSEISIGGPDAALFSLSKTDASLLAKDNTDDTNLTFNAASGAFGEKWALVTLATNSDGVSQLFEFKIKGTVSASAIAVSGKGQAVADNAGAAPASANGTLMGSILVSKIGKQQFTIKNTGNALLTLSKNPTVTGDGFTFHKDEPADPTDPELPAIESTEAAPVTTTSSGDEFVLNSISAVQQTYSTSSFLQIAPGDSRTFWVKYTPTSAGDSEGRVKIESNGRNAAVYEFQLKAKGLMPRLAVSSGNPAQPVANDLTVVPSAVKNTDFGIVTVGNTSSKTFTLSNPGTGALTIRAIQINGAISQFSCPTTMPITIQPQGTATFEARFKPTSNGEKNGWVRIVSNADGVAGFTYSFKIKGGSNVASILDFDGSNDYVDCGNPSALDISTFSITLEAWINADTWRSKSWEGSIINKEGNSQGYMIRCGDGGKISFNLGIFKGWTYGWKEVVTTEALSKGKWYHVAGVYNGSTMKIYVNGVEKASASVSGGIVKATRNVWIGSCQAYPDRRFDGKMDEVRIWTVARTAAEINASMNCELKGDEAGLAGYWNFNQGVPEGNNSTQTTLSSAKPGGPAGTLKNFSLSGTGSNFLNGSPVTGKCQ
jgi:hypothetical protein